MSSLLPPALIEGFLGSVVFVHSQLIKMFRLFHHTVREGTFLPCFCLHIFENAAFPRTAPLIWNFVIIIWLRLCYWVCVRLRDWCEEGRVAGYVAVQRLIKAEIATVVCKHPCTNENVNWYYFWLWTWVKGTCWGVFLLLLLLLSVLKKKERIGSCVPLCELHLFATSCYKNRSNGLVSAMFSATACVTVKCLTFSTY